MRRKSCVLLSAGEGKQNATFSPNFTQPGAHLLEIPCRDISHMTSTEVPSLPQCGGHISIDLLLHLRVATTKDIRVRGVRVLVVVTKLLVPNIGGGISLYSPFG